MWQLSTQYRELQHYTIALLSVNLVQNLITEMCIYYNCQKQTKPFRNQRQSPAGKSNVPFQFQSLLTAMKSHF